MKRFIRLTSHMALQAILVASLVLMPLAITGCSSTQVQDTLAVAAEVASAAAGIIGPVSPEYAGILNLVGSGIKDVSSLYSSYQAAVAADKPGIAGKLHAALTAITGNLNTILSDAHVRAPALVQEISVAVAIVNTAVTLVLAHLPQTTVTARIHAAQAGLPLVTTAKSASDLAKKWNDAVGVKYPQAVVTAPHHGVF